MSEEKYQFHIGHVQGLVVGEHNNASLSFLGREPFEQSKAQSPSLPIYHIPHRRNALFTGRENLLQELRERLISAKSISLTQPQAISGLGGIGKTQIALEYAYLYQNEYQAILWINSSSQEEILSDLIKIAEHLHLQVKDEHDHIVVVDTMRNWLENTTNWLLIFDNVEDLLTINTLLPAKNVGHIIITTRIQATGDIAQSIIVEKMNEHEAVLFLLRRAKVITNKASLDDVTSFNVAQAKEIVNLLDSLPLALDQAGAYIEETACGLANYLERYQQQKLKLLQRRGNFPTYHPKSVTTTWSLSFQKIAQTNPLATTLLTFCSFLTADAIPEELITQGAAYLAPVFPSLTGDLIDLDEAISTLRKYSLISRNSDEKMISIHRLVQAVLKENLDQSTQKQWVMGVTKVINHLFTPVYINTWEKFQKYLPHAYNCLTQIDQWKLGSVEAANLSKKMGMCLCSHGQFTEAEASCIKALQIINELLGTENTFSMEICKGLARVYYHQENFEKAEALLINALDIAQKKLHSSHVKILLILNDLAVIYEEKCNYEKAEKSFERFHELMESGRKYINSEIVYGMTRHANFLWHRGRYHQAEMLYQKILAIVERSCGTNHFYAAQIFDYMSEFYREQGKYDVAEPLYQRVLTILEHTFGPDHPHFARVINNLALLYYETGKYDLAEPLFKKSYTITQKIFGQNNTRSAAILNNLALLCRDRGEYDQAIPLFQRVYEIHSAVFGKISPVCGNTLNNWGAVYLKQNMLDTAETFFRAAFEVLEQTLGDHHPDVANVLGNLGVMYVEKEEYVQAEELLSLTLDIHKDAFGELSYTVAESVLNLALIYDKQGNNEKALLFYKDAITIFEEIVGTEHFIIISPLNNLADIYITQEKYDLAEIHLQRAITIGRKTNHPDLKALLSNLALLYAMQEKYNLAEITNLELISILEETHNRDPFAALFHYEELSKIYCLTERYRKSEHYFRKALVIRRQHFESDQKSMATTLSYLGFVCEKQGEYTQAKQFYGDALQRFRSVCTPEDPLSLLTSYRYDAVSEKINNSLVESFKEKIIRNGDKYTHQSKTGYTQKSKKKKRRKQR